MITKTSKPSMFDKTALCAILMMLSVIGFSMLGFAFGISMSAYSAVIPIAGIAIYSLIFDRDMLKSLIICLLVLIIWSSVCAKLFDWSYDGMYYHKQAVITLAKGWNPLRESCLAAEPLNRNADLALWLNHYPKGIWISSAALYIVTGYIETAKAVNILFIVMLFCLAYSVFRNVFDSGAGRSAFFAVLVCLNPVFISQIFTSYNDMAVGVLIISAAFLGMKIISEKASNYDYALLFSVTAMSCLVKFTAPLLVGLVLLAYGTGYVIKLRGKDLIEKFKKPAIVIMAGFLIGASLFGFDPYIKHIMNGKNLVYPVLGEDKYDIMNTNPPEGFYDKTQIEKYFLSLASETNNDKEQHYKLKIPFTVHPEEFSYLSNADTRLGGFGIWFSGVAILSILLALAVILSFRHKIMSETAILIITFFALGLFFPEAWWARYASYTYYIPVFLLFYASSSNSVRPIAYAISIVLMVNSMMNVVCVVRDSTRITSELNASLDEIKNQNKKIEIRINDFPSHLKLFEEKGISFEVAPDSIPDATLFFSDTKYRFLEE